MNQSKVWMSVNHQGYLVQRLMRIPTSEGAKGGGASDSGEDLRQEPRLPPFPMPRWFRIQLLVFQLSPFEVGELASMAPTAGRGAQSGGLRGIANQTAILFQKSLRMTTIKILVVNFTLSFGCHFSLF